MIRSARKSSMLGMCVAAVAALALGGCAASPTGAESKPEKATAAEEVWTAKPVVLGPACTQDSIGTDAGSTDSVHPLEQITDDFGVYCHVTYDPATPNLAWDPAAVDKSLEENGFTIDEAKAAKDIALKFFVEDVLDSALLDNPGIDADLWVKDHGANVDKGMYDYLLEESADPAEFGKAIVSHYLPRPINRTGGPRAAQTLLSPPTIYAWPDTKAKDGNKAYESGIGVSTAVTVQVTDASEAAIIETILRNYPNKTEADIRAEDPELFDGRTSGYLLTGQYTFSVVKGKVTGFSGSYKAYTSSGTPADIIVVD